MSDNREGKSVLTLKNVTKRFSGLVAVNDLSLDMKERTIHALIGPNGAGKSTAINMITGLLPLTEGEIYHEGTKISGMSAHQIAQTRCSRTFQNMHICFVDKRFVFEDPGIMNQKAVTAGIGANHPICSFRPDSSIQIPIRNIGSKAGCE